MSTATAPPVQKTNTVAKAWMRAIELTAPIAKRRGRTLPSVIEELARVSPDAPALLADVESFTYGELAGRINQYARWALAQGIGKGETVCLIMRNRPEYLAIWLGITKVGGVVALANTNLQGAALAHSIHIVAARHVIVAADLVSCLPVLESSRTVWVHGSFDLESYSTAELTEGERRPVSIEDRALFIFTSGTTGLPKAAKVSHARLLQWSYWFAGMLDARASDRLYNCLPMYHSVGGVLAPGAILVAGGSLVVAEKFSASHFWNDVIRWDCTLLQYIGELCRYLLHAAPVKGHKVRIACGNGLRPDVWEAFQDRFAIPQILEFYAATEGGVSLFNIEGKCGSIGRVPPYLAHRFAPTLVRFNVDKDEPVRDEDGFCIRCGPNETGEAIGQVSEDPANIGSRFEGYTDDRATDKRILRNAFKQGDAWARTGDLMRKDPQGFFYFVDRIGDTFRWKGENVATLEVAEAIAECAGVKESNVYGVKVAGAEGRAGMAMLVVEDAFDLNAFRSHLVERLPRYARPLFLRLRAEVELTGTFKYAKSELMRVGYDPALTSDPLYCDTSHGFVRVDAVLFEQIQRGEIRL